MSTHKTVLITGANRGIGLGLTLKFLQGGWHVIATARNPDGARELWELEHGYPGKCRVVALDVSHGTSIDHLAKELKGQRIDMLINNAGMIEDRDAAFPAHSAVTLAKTLAVNTVAPFHVTQVLLPNLQLAPAPVVATISSIMGSIESTTSGGYYAYRMSKAAVNAFVKTLAAEYPKVTVLALHPGWVQTDMGGAGASISVDESTNGLHHVLSAATIGQSGKFLDYRGKQLPW